MANMYAYRSMIRTLNIQEDNPMAITPHDIAKMLDHSTLQPFLTEADIRKGCELALKYDCASVCARPCDVPILAEMLAGSDVKVCTVIGVPHGSHETAIKVAEARLALEEGCTELDMVINIGKMIAGDTLYVKNEIKLLADLAHQHGAILKVILETCYLTDEQKIACCKLAEEAGADFVKTSTGFSKAGATVEDVRLMRKTVGPDMGVKAAGGVHNKAEALAMIEAGATRIGASSGIAIVSE